MEHTKGKWEAIVCEESGEYKKWTIHPRVADVFLQTEEGEANARLIAAAPQLLQALRSVEWTQVHASFARACPWCGEWEGVGHKQNCERQVVLSLVESRR
jgi:hypothetical protein